MGAEVFSVVEDFTQCGAMRHKLEPIEKYNC